MSDNQLELATFGAGCFWCTEAVFQNVKGVSKVVSGYAGGKVKNPTYREICTGTTGHAEVAQITFDPSKVSFEELLEVFWNTHDPTTLNKQGADEGTQYRSVIFYHSDDQRQAAEEYKSQLESSKVYQNPIVTEISPLPDYYPAENYHQNYFVNHSEQGYCTFVVAPKVRKLGQYFQDWVKT